VAAPSAGTAGALPEPVTRMETADAARLLDLLEQLMAIETRDVDTVLDEAATRIADALGVEKVDSFFLEGELLRARGTSRTELGRLQQQMGLDVLQVANGGRMVEVLRTGKDHLDGHVQDDEGELRGIKEMGVRSTLATPIFVGDQPQGVLGAASLREDAFDDEDLQLIRAIARWVGVLKHRAQLLESATRAALEEGRRLAAEELVTVLAHDLGNYLTPLRGRLEFALREARRDERARDEEVLAASIASIDEIAALTTDLLNVSRIEEGILVLRPETTPLRPLIERAARALATEDVKVVLDVSPQLTVKVDLLRVSQVFTNLISNAVKHSPRGGTVTIDAIEDGDVVIRVMDEGPGVPSDLMPRVFMRYARGPRSTGLGIGLYLAERIARAHGGSLTLDSSTTGATFALRLPAGDRDPRPLDS
jgi:two-component system OmpR family sensor kinase